MKAKPGDVILYPVTGRSSLISRLVAAGQVILGIGQGHEVYSHAAILSNQDGWQYEAKFPWSGHFPIDVSREYEVWRIGEPTDDQRHRILTWCAGNLGRWYNLTGLLTDGLWALRRSYVCSQFAGKAYSSAHIKIKTGGNRVLAPDVIPDYPGAVLIARYVPKVGRII